MNVFVTGSTGLRETNLVQALLETPNEAKANFYDREDVPNIGALEFSWMVRDSEPSWVRTTTKLEMFRGLYSLRSIPRRVQP